MQYSINYDPSVLSFVSVGNFNLDGLNVNQFGSPPETAAGVITLSWFDGALEGLSVPDGTALFEMCFDVVGIPGSTSTIVFSNNPAQIEITDSDEQVVDFNGVNGIINIADGPIEGFVLDLEDTTICPEESPEFCLNVSTLDFNDIIGVQLSLNYDPNQLEFVSVGEFGLVGLDVTKFGTPPDTEDGMVTLSWFDNSLGGATLPDGSVLFEICFNAIGEDGSTTIVQFSGNPTAIEITDMDENLVPFNGLNGMVVFSCFVPDPLEISSSSVTDILCNGDATGQIDIEIAGGVEPYTYEWSNDAASQDLNGVLAGDYSVSVSSADGQISNKTPNRSDNCFTC